jgi:hypothetical protein
VGTVGSSVSRTSTRPGALSLSTIHARYRSGVNPHPRPAGQQSQWHSAECAILQHAWPPLPRGLQESSDPPQAPVAGGWSRRTRCVCILHHHITDADASGSLSLELQVTCTCCDVAPHGTVALVLVLPDASLPPAVADGCCSECLRSRTHHRLVGVDLTCCIVTVSVESEITNCTSCARVG